MFALLCKSLHLFFIISWFAGLFYLPRIFVNLAMASRDSVAEYGRLLLMAGKLYRFMTPLGVLALGFGLILWLGFGYSGAWLHVKAFLAALLVIFHGVCAMELRRFRLGINTRSHLWFRVFNEIPALIMLAAVLLAIFKPF
ncbi:MAG: CopD family protein [Zoogloeaceae bacterium]|jgi:putative membrane protein|nr:CopD family protein [Zoogloeaceae bacterium]